ncbi:MAG TPA: orotidine 5'-phosphate decarboxylase / HUMPS family protein, partial [Polyangia bacterium]
MLRRAVAAAGGVEVIAVTVLTSLDAADLARDRSAVARTEELVLARAALAAEAGCAGVVCSPLEAAAVRKQHPRLVIITPGVRRHAASDDQTRVDTPAAARRAGADAVVVGRPIRDAQDRRAAAAAIVRELEG